MAKKQSAPPERRRSRGEIDRNYFFGDVLIKTGVAIAFALAGVILYTQHGFRIAFQDHLYDYLTVISVFAVLGVAAFFLGHHLRSTATHWDFD
ncbi:MAG TPA: hypothetical protein VG943_10375 [Caulobacterales bacterium]|nr:hypothetical protein [Caulobacterales bacterium]